MIKLFKSKKLLLRIGINEMELVDLSTNKSVKKVAEPPFSRNELLIGEFTVAYSLLLELLDTLYGRKTFYPRRDVAVHPRTENNTPLREIEKSTITDLCKQAGMYKIAIADPNETVNHQKALALLSK